MGVYVKVEHGAIAVVQKSDTIINGKIAKHPHLEIT